MNATFIDVATECTEGSDDGSLSFPQVVMKLMAAGVERYHADLTRAEKTYYLPDGGSHVLASAPVEGPPAKEFSAGGVEAAVREIQAGKLTYKAFCARIAAAGCVAYDVYLDGRRAVYYGRKGDSYAEPFPAKK